MYKKGLCIYLAVLIFLVILHLATKADAARRDTKITVLPVQQENVTSNSIISNAQLLNILQTRLTRLNNMELIDALAIIREHIVVRHNTKGSGHLREEVRVAAAIAQMTLGLAKDELARVKLRAVLRQEAHRNAVAVQQEIEHRLDGSRRMDARVVANQDVARHQVLIKQKSRHS